MKSDGKALCVQCGRISKQGFGKIKHEKWCKFYRIKK